MEPIAVYRRTIRASVPRIWENVLDWEHLPWLHAASFLDVELLEGDAEGWRAWVSSPPADTPGRSLVDVRVHRADRYYWTRTLEGFGAGSDIRTSLAPRGDRATEIAVEFFVPDLPVEAVPVVGAAYERLYARLWDEDEAMMVRRQALLDASPRAAAVPAPVKLGSIAALRARLPVVVGTDHLAVRLVEIEGEIIVHSAVCPHLGGPLERGELCGWVLTCPWHGYRFDLRTGAGVDGASLRLAPAPRLEVDARGMATLVW